MTDVSRHLPSLNQLRAFEAAARHESIKAGAEELCVTPTAVGHQIKALEQALKTPLFHRKIRKITLTNAGRELAAEVSLALDRLERAVESARNPDLSGVLKISVAPFLGNRWLLPRLPDFHRKHADLQIETHMSFDYVDLEQSGFDAAIRYGAGIWAGLSARLIFHDTLGVVCAPQLIEGQTLPLTADEIFALPRASARNWSQDWPAWALAAGASTGACNAPTEHQSRAFVFDAALSGQAAILADKRMTAADEAVGRLVSLSDVTIKRPQGIYIVSPENRIDPRIEVFANWLTHQARVTG